MAGPVVPFHEFLAKSWAASCFLESLGESSWDSFTLDSEAGFGGWNERDDFQLFLSMSFLNIAGPEEPRDSPARRVS